MPDCTQGRGGCVLHYKISGPAWHCFSALRYNLLASLHLIQNGFLKEKALAQSIEGEKGREKQENPTLGDQGLIL